MTALQTWREGGRLWIRIDTPGSSVNVFGPRPAVELRRILESLPPDVTQLVLCSGKAGSFINGAGLLYANSMKSTHAARGVSEEVRGTYQLLATLPIQTVSVIEGNCYGCGLELALCCDLRVAREVYEAHFKMTELVDYRFVPLFGGTWRLPRRLGVPLARRLLLDGEIWSAGRARRAGLVDVLLPAQASEARLRRTLDALASRPPPVRRARATAPPPRPPVPPSRAPLWALTERLIRTAPRRTPSVAAAAELKAFSRTVTSPEAKAAMRFFFLRHMAHAASWGASERRLPTLGLRPPGGSGPVARMLRQRQPSRTPEVTLAVRAMSARSARVGETHLLWPLGVGRRLCEVRVPHADPGEGREIARYLDWIGFEPVLTRGAHSASQRLLQVTRTTLKGFGRREVEVALWRFGFDRSLVPPRRRLTPVRTSACEDLRIVRPLLLAWRDTLERLLSRGVLVHPSQGEVLVHELFGFPLERGSLLWWLERGGAEASG